MEDGLRGDMTGGGVRGRSRRTGKESSKSVYLFYLFYRAIRTNKSLT